MAASTGSLSLTRPRDARELYASNAVQPYVGLALAATGLMALVVFFIISAVVAGWVSDQDPTQFARITTYESWLFPVAVAAIALAKVGIAVVLWGVVRRLWVRVESIKESLPALTQRGGGAS
jgi:hypothetical protein